MINRFFCLAGILCCSSSLFSLSIDEALKSSLKHYKLKEAQEKVKQRKEGKLQAYSGFLPKVDAKMDLNRQNQRRSNDQNSGNRRDTTSQYGLSLQQNLFNGGGTFAAVKESQAALKQAEYSEEVERQKVIQEAAESYLELLSLHKALEINDANLKFLKQQYENARQKHEAGEETITNLESARAQYLEGEIRDLSGKDQLENQKHVFVEKTGLDATTIDHLAFPENVKRIPQTVDEAIQTAKKQHPALLQLDAVIQQKEASIQQQYAQHLPSVNLNSGYDHRISRSTGQQPFSQPKDKTESTSIGISAEINLFNGGKRQAAVREAAHARSEAILNRKRIENELNVQIQKYWTEMKIYDQQMKNYEKVVQATKVSLNSIMEEQKAGSKTLLDVLEQQKKFFEAQRALIEAQTKYYKACFGLLASMGIIKTVVS